MVAIAPFRALRYAPEIDADKVTSPPHDVIDDVEQAAFRASDAHNIVHIIQPEGDEASRFQHAADLLTTWEADGALVRDGGPAFYRYQIQHDRGTMDGFFARLRTDPTYQHVKRHEKTLPGKKRTRLDLRIATRCDTESIWMLYRDERGWVDEILASNAFDKIVETTDEDGATHTVWRVDRPAAVEEIVAQFAERDIVIADGHHRYQTSLDHHAETGRDEDGSILVCLVRDTHPGLRIEPTHRIIRRDISLDEAIEAAHEHWEVADWTEALDPAALREWVDADPRRALLLRDGLAATLVLRDGHEVDEGRGRLDSLVVTRVHDRLLAAFGIGPDDVEEALGFTRSAEEAVAVSAGSLVVMLTGEEVDAVLDVASQGHVMPQKATYFVPKLRSGLLLGPLDEPLPMDWTGGEGGASSFQLPAVE